MRKQALPEVVNHLWRFFVDNVSIQLIVLAAAALLLTVAVTDNRVMAKALFQSPESPVEQPPQPEAPAPAPAPQEAPVQPPAPVPQEAPAGGESQPAPPAPAVEPLPPPLPEPQRQPLPSQVGNDETGDDQNLTVDQAEFIDTVVVSLAWLWLCCGVILILLIPLVFLFLHIRGRSKISKEEKY